MRAHILSRGSAACAHVGPVLDIHTPRPACELVGGADTPVASSHRLPYLRRGRLSRRKRDSL